MKNTGIIFFLLLISFQVNAQTIPAQADSIMKLLYPANAPGAALLIEKGGKVIIEKGYGLADLGTGRRITPSTNFRMASVSKQFTAMSILLLAKENKLSIQDPISKYFPYLPVSSQNITIEQLLTHASGIWNYEVLIPVARKTQVSDEDVLHLIEGKDSTYFVPGTKFQYSNTGYCLLALIVQRVSGIPFAEFVRNKIFIPLSMTRSFEYSGGENIADRAYGYHFDNGRYHFADQSITSATEGDGGVYTSLKDYEKWNTALAENKLLPAGWMGSIFTPHIWVKDQVGYGYGWFISQEKDGSRCMFHSGESTGFHNVVFRDPQDRLLIAIFTNRDDDAIGKAFDEIMKRMNVQIPFKKSAGEISLFNWLSKVYGD